MHKKILPVLIGIALSFTSHSQPILTSLNMGPALGDTFVTITCDTSFITQGSSGANQNWDFSLLTTTSVNTGAAVNPAFAPGYAPLSAYPGSAVPSSNRAVQDMATHVTSYYALTSGKLSVNGTYVSDTALAAYTDPMDQLHFPFTYLGSFTDVYAGVVYFKPPIGPAILASESGKDTVTADAYGNLTLPPVPPSSTPVTYTNVLRVHSRQSFRDSANLFGTPLVETYELESYTWYQAGYHTALLTISTANSPAFSGKVVSYAQKQLTNHEDVPSVSGIDASLKLFPNPAQHDLNIEYYTATNRQPGIIINDILGQQVATLTDKPGQGQHKITYNTTALPKGIYSVSLISGSETVTRKIEIQ